MKFHEIRVKNPEKIIKSSTLPGSLSSLKWCKNLHQNLLRKGTVSPCSLDPSTGHPWSISNFRASCLKHGDSTASPNIRCLQSTSPGDVTNVAEVFLKHCLYVYKYIYIYVNVILLYVCYMSICSQVVQLQLAEPNINLHPTNQRHSMTHACHHQRGPHLLCFGQWIRIGIQ